MSSNNIINSLGLNPISFEDKKVQLAPQSESEDEEAEMDIQNARHGLYKALDYSREALEDMLSIAKQSQHPKAYEVLNTTIKTLADISSEIGTLQLKKQRLKKKGDGSEDQNGNVINNLFVGSTAELQQMLENLNNKKEDE